MRVIFVLLSSFLISCSSTDTINTPEGVDVVHFSSGVEQFFLTDIPYWANFSTAGSCFRKTPIRFLNFEKLSKSYALNYTQILHLQHMLNKKMYAYKTSTGQANLSPKDESYVFHNVYQQVLGGSFDFTIPRFNNISIVWIDPFLNDTKKIKRVLNREDVLSGHPIILSHCLSSYELEELAQKLELDELGVKYLSAEMLNVFSIELKKNTFFSMNVSEIFKGKNLNLFSTKDSSEFIGDYKFIKIK